ncbi:MAG: acylneuraminate cytidylyltransferase family protein [Candidatus Rokubacteria bacterium]|nr:acylneuraminate cytidylyltransferase family protein [Candidatus Rokubacteria bacterium]
MRLGVIPARGGSKGVPRKNLRPLLGRPLIAWSIDAARNARGLDRFVVSTEDAEIAEVARREGAEVLPRPAALATDTATTKAVLQHVVEALAPDEVVVLQPTSPVRVDNLVDRAIERYLASGAETLATGFTSFHYAWATMDNVPRQQMTGFFYDDGNVYVHRADDLRAGRYWGERREPMVVARHYNHEIDDELDFVIVEAVMRELLARRGSLA